jgi:site-specific DNA recombinase
MAKVKEDRGMDTKPRVAIYARVSSQEQAIEGVSIEAQLATLQAYAKSQGWGVVDEYIDGGYSGGIDERPAFRRLMIDAAEHRFNIIAVCKLDRFFRNLRLLLNHLHRLEQLGIKFIATQEGLDTSTPYGKFAVQIMGVIAEFERDRIGERVKDSKRYLISKGNWPGGRTIFGYRWLSDQRSWEVVPEEAKIVQRIYDLYVNDKIGTESIAAILNKDGLSTRGGARWHLSNVSQILSHPGYKGHHKIGIPMPAIIDENTWQLAQERREKARSVLVNPRGWLLQGMCFCGQCGHVLKCLRKKPREPRYYACRSRVQKHMNRNNDKRCNLPYVRADWLEWGVWKKVKAILNDSDKLAECVNKALIELEGRKSQIGAETLTIDNKLETIRTKKERLGMVFADGAVSENTYKSKIGQLKKQEAAILKCRHNIDPLELTELSTLEARIAMVKDVLNKGTLSVSEFGIFGELGTEYIPAGFNAWRECDGELVIGEVTEMGTFRIEGTDKVMRGVDAPPGFWECQDLEQREEHIKKNMRAILQLFNITVLVFPERVEIKGTIPTQILDRLTKEGPATALINSSPSPFLERGKIILEEGLAPLLNTPFS